MSANNIVIIKQVSDRLYQVYEQDVESTDKQLILEDSGLKQAVRVAQDWADNQEVEYGIGFDLLDESN